jgi:hypothetical protein
LGLVPLIGLTPGAEATGGAFCAISGSINLVPSDAVPGHGTWSVDPAIIDCRGIFRGYERITGPAGFSGSGTYTSIQDGGGCLQHVGTGKIDYMIPTTEADVHIVERHEFVLAGAGTFRTPSLNGSFQATAPYEGDCLTGPVQATFVAQGLLVRANGLGPG